MQKTFLKPKIDAVFGSEFSKDILNTYVRTA